MNLFDKPDEQNEARFNSAMARKGGMKFNLFDKPDEQNEARFNSAMARKGGMKFNLFIAKVTKNVDFTNATNRHFFDFLRWEQASI